MEPLQQHVMSHVWPHRLVLTDVRLKIYLMCSLNSARKQRHYQITNYKLQIQVTKITFHSQLKRTLKLILVFLF